MPPIVLKIKGSRPFLPFANLDNEEDLSKTWRVCTKVKDSLENGSRLENLSWRLWHLHQLVASGRHKGRTASSEPARSALSSPALEYAGCASEAVEPDRASRHGSVASSIDDESTRSTFRALSKNATRILDGGENAEQRDFERRLRRFDSSSRSRCRPQGRSDMDVDSDDESMGLASRETRLKRKVENIDEEEEEEDEEEEEENEDDEEAKVEETPKRTLHDNRQSYGGAQNHGGAISFGGASNAAAMTVPGQSALSSLAPSAPAAGFAPTTATAAYPGRSSMTSVSPLAAGRAITTTTNTMLPAPSVVYPPYQAYTTGNDLSALAGAAASIFPQLLGMPGLTDNTAAAASASSTLTGTAAGVLLDDMFGSFPAAAYIGDVNNPPTIEIPLEQVLSAGGIDVAAAAAAAAAATMSTASTPSGTQDRLNSNYFDAWLGVASGRWPADPAGTPQAGSLAPSASTSPRVDMQTHAITMPGSASAGSTPRASTLAGLSQTVNVHTGGSVQQMLGNASPMSPGFLATSMTAPSAPSSRSASTMSVAVPQAPSSVHSYYTSPASSLASASSASPAGASMQRSVAPSVAQQTMMEANSIGSGVASLATTAASSFPGTNIFYPTTGMESRSADSSNPIANPFSNTPILSTPSSAHTVQQSQAKLQAQQQQPQHIQPQPSAQTQQLQAHEFSAKRPPTALPNDPQQLFCRNCGVTSTPLWRRSANDELLCNACGLYLKLHNMARPKVLKPQRKESKAGAGSGANSNHSKQGKMVCSNCETTNTPLWRRDDQGAVLCNACGLYLKLHHERRPLSLKTDVIKKRQRFDANSKQKKTKQTESGGGSDTGANNGATANSPTSASVKRQRCEASSTDPSPCNSPRTLQSSLAQMAVERNGTSVAIKRESGLVEAHMASAANAVPPTAQLSTPSVFQAVWPATAVLSPSTNGRGPNASVS